jgi:hypothetical protein
MLAKVIEEEGANAGGPSAGNALPSSRMRAIYAGKALNDEAQV